MDKVDAQKLNKFLDLANTWLEEQLKPPVLPSFETAVESRVKNLVLTLGTDEIFDKLGKGDRPALDALINRQKAEITGQAEDAIVKTFSDTEYLTVKQKEIETAVASALKEKEEHEKEAAK